MEFTEEQSKRFWAKVNKKGDNECWEWQAYTDKNGYGQFQSRSAHRCSYSMCNGDIPDGLIVRHKCDNPPCVNPNHLLLGTTADNVRDRDSRGRNGHTNKTHCKNGHEFTKENTFLKVRKGRGITRGCRECKRKIDRQRYIRRIGKLCGKQ